METKAHMRLTQEAGDRVAVYVLGGMKDAEASRFEEHLLTCAPCREEASALRPVASDLLLAAPEADPPPGLRERVLARAREHAFTFLPTVERGWHASGEPGVEICQLWLDEPNERHTILIRMANGASVPTHLHAGTEECFVIHGDLRSGDLRMGAGDYVRFEGGTRHSISTEEGCLLLVTSSLHDRRIEPAPPSR